MTLKERNDKIEEFFNSCKEILTSKGLDYASKTDAYANFTDTANVTKFPPRKILLVLLHKHMRAIYNAVDSNPDNPTRNAESFVESCRDAVNYLSILAVWPIKKGVKDE